MEAQTQLTQALEAIRPEASNTDPVTRAEAIAIGAIILKGVEVAGQQLRSVTETSGWVMILVAVLLAWNLITNVAMVTRLYILSDRMDVNTSVIERNDQTEQRVLDRLDRMDELYSDGARTERSGRSGRAD